MNQNGSVTLPSQFNEDFDPSPFRQVDRMEFKTLFGILKDRMPVSVGVSILCCLNKAN